MISTCEILCDTGVHGKNRWAGHRRIFQRYMSRVEHKSANSDILTFLRNLHKDYFDGLR